MMARGEQTKLNRIRGNGLEKFTIDYINAVAIYKAINKLNFFCYDKFCNKVMIVLVLFRITKGNDFKT